MTNSLDVYLYGDHIATITRRNRALRLNYLPHYIDQADATPISVMFPVAPGQHDSQLVSRFLENLLPDRADVKTKWARDASLTSEDPFDLLSVYGADVAGALEFYPSGVRVVRSSGLQEVGESDISDRIRQIRQDDSDWLGEGRAELHPFSLGGAQGKFALASHDGKWYEATGASPSTHIFKPGVKGLPGSEVTEHITTQVARSLGLLVAETEIRCFGGEHVLVVKRFDRVSTPEGAARLHQEDLAQATGTALLNKYESNNGPSYLDIFQVFDKNLSPMNAREAKQRFAESLVFSWIIGHDDGHSKNYSLMHSRRGSTLAPFYDLNSILPFELDSTVRAKDFRAFDSKRLAFDVHGAKTIGDYAPTTFHLLEKDAELEEGTLVNFAFYVASHLSANLNRVIADLPQELQGLRAVKNFPFAMYAQTLRVADMFSE